MSHDDFAFEPVPGLPEALPEGEHILWQGAPKAYLLAGEVFHWRAVTLYFAALMAWRGIDAAGFGLLAALGSALALLPVAVLAIGLLWLLSIASARTTLYTLTNKRVAMRIGIAIPVTLNLPLTKIASADFKPLPGGAGSIALVPADPLGLTYFQLWPHVRPLSKRTAPMLRCITDAAELGETLRKLLIKTHKPLPVGHQGMGEIVTVAA